MYSRFYKIVVIAIFIFMMPIYSFAIDQNNLLLKFIKYSYPEVKVLQKDDTKEKNSNNKDEEQYVNVYVGKENIPTINNKNGNEINLYSEEYKSNLRTTNDKPEILIYHSHSCETYFDSPEGNYHSEDKDHSVLSIGCLLTNELSDLGWGVVHSTKYHDSPTYNNSYQRSSQTIKSVMNKYDSVKITIDLHRDGLNISNKKTQDSAHKRYTTTIDGESVAKIFFVVGARNEDVEKVKELADGITEYASKKYPDLIMPVVLKPYGRFNQSICDNALLVEVGSNATTTKEAQSSTKYLAEILDGYFKEKNL